ncbi:MAG: exonuclease domain-containing protein, partial [Pseudoflavonifractor sp.]
MAEQKIPFLKLFSAWSPQDELRTLAEACLVTTAKIDKATRSICANLLAPILPTAEQKTRWQAELAAAYKVDRVDLNFQQDGPEQQNEQQNQPDGGQDKEEEPGPVDAYSRTEEIRRKALKSLKITHKTVQKTAETPHAGKIIFGKRAITKAATPMGELDLDMGLVVVEGDVFCVENRELKKRGAWVVAFDMTDYSGSIRINKFFPGDEGKAIVSGVKEGQHLLVQGRLTMDRFSGDMVLEPMAITMGQKPARMDKAQEKRVELHLHTTMSAMDALTDTKQAVKCAETWGHRAIAITDHGVAQSFPDAWHAANKIKVLYGVEAYYVNDVDDRVAVHGDREQPLTDEIVCFDIETTGLDKRSEAITEIGAVILRNGEVCERFNTFADPGKPLSVEITELTGITDDMLRGAPPQAEAIRAFLDFAGGRVLAAHNAEFDMGFIAEGCRRAELPFEYTSLDSLVLAQNLLPDLGKYKLDIVAEHLNLPAFNHHRASDDAATVAYMLIPFFRMLADKGVGSMQQINPLMLQLRGGGKAKRQAKHLIVLAKNNIGLRNLYKLVSLSHLEHFKRFPIMPKSVINEHREGLIIGS